MNIAIIGSPGSGKSELAQALASELAPCQVVDDYIPEIQREMNIQLDFITDYIGNLAVALGRYGRERVAREAHDSVITCGTLIETAVYSALHFVTAHGVSSDAVRTMAAARIEATVRIYACLYNDAFDYDRAFYLPPQSQDDQMVAELDRQLQVAVEGFRFPVTALLEPETRVAQALEVIREVPAS